MALDRDLVHIQGKITSSEFVRDQLIPEVFKKDCVKLVRHVQMYTETKTEKTDNDGNTIYVYDYKWEE